MLGVFCATVVDRACDVVVGVGVGCSGVLCSTVWGCKVVEGLLVIVLIGLAGVGVFCIGVFAPIEVEGCKVVSAVLVGGVGRGPGLFPPDPGKPGNPGLP